ncbi:MAG: VOC family protein, partial [Candidatus Hodarchaeota archaeon]
FPGITILLQMLWTSRIGSKKAKFSATGLRPIQERLNLLKELIEVVEGETTHTKFLREKGEGLHHIGFIVEDIEEELIKLEKAGISVLERGIVQEMVKFAYLDTEKSLGIILELIQLAL